MEKNTWFETINSLVLVIAALIPIYFLFKTTPSQITSTAVVIFGIIIGVIILIVIFSFIYQRYKNMSNGIINNKNELNEIKKDLNFKELFNQLDVRVRVLEQLLKMNNKKRGKEGQIDPRIIGWIILIILVILFLRQISNN